MGWFIDFMDAASLILYGVDTKKAKQERAARRSTNRSFPANNGTVDGQPAYVQQRGNRTVAYSGPNHVGKVVSNDGLNADYVRNDDGEVAVDNQSPDPSNPQPWRRH